MNKKIVITLLIGGLVLCCCSVIGGVGAWYYFSSQKQPIITTTPKPTPTTIVDDTDDDDDYDDDAPILTDTFIDTFDDNTNGWILGEYDGQYIDSDEQIRDGKLYYYAIADAEDGGFAYDSLYQVPYMNFTASIEGKQISGSAEADYGIIFRKNVDDYQYMFFINEEYGEYILSAYTEDGFIDIMEDWVETSLINTDSPNTLKVTAIENQIKLYINGVLVETIYDDTLMDEGDIGFVVNLYEKDQEATIAFDDLTITEE